MRNFYDDITARLERRRRRDYEAALAELKDRFAKRAEREEAALWASYPGSKQHRRDRRADWEGLFDADYRRRYRKAELRAELLCADDLMRLAAIGDEEERWWAMEAVIDKSVPF